MEDKIAHLESELDAATKKKNELAQQVEDCTLKLERAEKLIGGLGGERTRWTETVEQLKKDLVNVVGDVVVSSGTIAYLGPFTPAFRQMTPPSSGRWSSFPAARTDRQPTPPAGWGKTEDSSIPPPTAVNRWRRKSQATAGAVMRISTAVPEVCEVTDR